MEVFLLIILGLLSLNGLYWTVFWIKNFAFLVAFHQERAERAKLDKKGRLCVALVAEQNTRTGATIANCRTKP